MANIVKSNPLVKPGENVIGRAEFLKMLQEECGLSADFIGRKIKVLLDSDNEQLRFSVAKWLVNDIIGLKTIKVARTSAKDYAEAIRTLADQADKTIEMFGEEIDG